MWAMVMLKLRVGSDESVLCRRRLSVLRLSSVVMATLLSTFES